MKRRLFLGLSTFLILAGAAGVLAGVLSPWAQVTLFQDLGLHLSGLLFAQGGLCLSAALLVLLGMRRSALLCLAAALVMLHGTMQARVEVPHLVKHQIIGAQLALFPLNRLLDQFHIPDVTISNWSIPDTQLLAPGLSWTVKSALILLLGSLLGLPTDPVISWLFTEAFPTRCRICHARWRRTRNICFCPQCGTATSVSHNRQCPICATEASASDHYCVQCGEELP